MPPKPISPRRIISPTRAPCHNHHHHHHHPRRGFALGTPPLPRQAAALSAQDAAARMLDAFGSATLVRRQLIDGNQLQKLALTLGRPLGPSLDHHNGSGVDVSGSSSSSPGSRETTTTPAQGTPVPPGYHLVYFTPADLERDLGPDGTDTAFNAPGPFTRRMWAGGRMSWPAAGAAAGGLRVGDEAEERTRLVSATAKSSRSVGEMVLVEVEKEVRTARGVAVVDRRSWIFRPALDAGAEARPAKRVLGGEVDARGPTVIEDLEAESGGVAPSRQFRWSPTGLFRFSALTFNGHKIHYNEDWAARVEGHPGLVVHGPLNLMNILDYWRDVHGAGKDPHEITYRAVAPLYAGERYVIRTEGSRADDTAAGGRLWDINAVRDGSPAGPQRAAALPGNHAGKHQPVGDRRARRHEKPAREKRNSSGELEEVDDGGAPVDDDPDPNGGAPVDPDNDDGGAEV
ncbi:hypothetical protein F5Y15DRAFT_419121 [Xylariaceae sp. FL0016]|nr:hypothetical protein F5Y15DRAFT_419121 [Xylariaceae sp. FL0016]